ncbi:MAG: radical SAM protein [Candidatus Aenigmarchaeota archaeon]|nr:radical SAM protein [Candidatus Aenigmarchaeota archaeon]
MEKVIFDLLSTFQFFKYLLGYNLFVKLGWPKILPSFLTFSVNNYCNQLCKTCNIWKNNPIEEKKKELKLNEIERIFSQFPKIFWLTITGGEPFLRRDLVEIVKIAYEKSKVNVLTITTNGSLPDIIEKDVKEILMKCKNLTIIVNVSIDGDRELHDKIRGIKGSFDKAVETIEKLKKIKSRRLIVGINSVISIFNVGKLYNLLNVIRKLSPDSFAFCVAQNREKLFNLDLNISPSVSIIRKNLLYLVRYSLEKRKGVIGTIKNFLRLRFYRYILNPSLMNNKPNFEGIATVYLLSDGRLTFSEISLLEVGNLRYHKFTLPKLLFSKIANKYRKYVNSVEYKKRMMENPFIVNQLISF